jgi:hypothetical protein
VTTDASLGQVYSIGEVTDADFLTYVRVMLSNKKYYNKKSFAVAVHNILKERGWDSYGKFQMHVRLSKHVYEDIINERGKGWSSNIIMVLIAAVCRSEAEGRELIRMALHSFDNSGGKKQSTFAKLLEYYAGRTIDAWDAAYRELGLQLLQE